VPGKVGWDPEEDSALADDIARAQPDDELDARVAAVAFLRARGSQVPLVRVAGYELERSLGGGGFGRVYLAAQPGLDRKVAFKLLHRHRSTPGTEWLRREASALAQLSHPNVVQIFQVGDSAHGTFIAMEYVEGETLRQWQAGRPWDEVLQAYVQAGLGLAAAHARRIVHLDFKPTNVLVGRDNRVRLADFGLAGGTGLHSSSADGGSTHLAEPQTRPWGGTEGYASPEQAAGARVDEASDQFSFCVSLYEAMHGVLPYSADDITAMSKHPSHRLTPRRGQRRCPRWVDAALRRGLAALPEERWASMTALLDGLTPRSWRPRAHGFVLLAAVTVVPVSIVGLGAVGRESCREATEDLVPTWDTWRREATAGALADDHASRGTNVPRMILERLDEHAAAAIDTALAVCAAGRADGSDDSELRTAQRRCLQRHRARFDRVVDLLVEGGPAASEHADALVAELGGPRECEQPTSPRNGSGDAENPRAIEVASDIDLVRLDLVAGKLADADERAGRTLALAEQVDEPALRVEAQLVRGLVRDARGQDEEALADLDESGLAALAIGRDDLAAESWRRAGWIAGNDLGDLERADRWCPLARAALHRLGEPPRATAEQLDTEGLLLRLAGDPHGAEAKHRAALLQLELVLARDDPRWITTWQLLAHALADRGDPVEASRWYDRALALASGRLGELHPQVAATLLARALIARERSLRDGDSSMLGTADDDLRRAAEIMIVGPGTNPGLLAAIRTLHAEIALLLGRLDDAEALAREAWALQEEHLPQGHAERGSALAVLARVDLARGDWTAALASHLSLAREREGVDDDATQSATENNIGWLLCRLDRCVEARRHYQRALDDGDARQRAYAQGGLGRVALAAGDADDAQVRLEAALTMARALGAETPPDLVAEIEWHLAQARLAKGERAELVRPLVDRALEFYRASDSDPLALAELERLARQLPPASGRKQSSTNPRPPAE